MEHEIDLDAYTRSANSLTSKLPRYGNDEVEKTFKLGFNLAQNINLAVKYAGRQMPDSETQDSDKPIPAWLSIVRAVSADLFIADDRETVAQLEIFRRRAGAQVNTDLNEYRTFHNNTISSLSTIWQNEHVLGSQYSPVSILELAAASERTGPSLTPEIIRVVEKTLKELDSSGDNYSTELIDNVFTILLGSTSYTYSLDMSSLGYHDATKSKMAQAHQTLTLYAQHKWKSLLQGRSEDLRVEESKSLQALLVRYAVFYPFLHPTEFEEILKSKFPSIPDKEVDYYVNIFMEDAPLGEYTDTYEQSPLQLVEDTIINANAGVTMADISENNSATRQIAHSQKKLLSLLEGTGPLTLDITHPHIRYIVVLPGGNGTVDFVLVDKNNSAHMVHLFEGQLFEIHAGNQDVESEFSSVADFLLEEFSLSNSQPLRRTNPDLAPKRDPEAERAALEAKRAKERAELLERIRAGRQAAHDAAEDARKAANAPVVEQEETPIPLHFDLIGIEISEIQEQIQQEVLRYAGNFGNLSEDDQLEGLTNPDGIEIKGDGWKAWILPVAGEDGEIKEVTVRTVVKYR